VGEPKLGSTVPRLTPGMFAEYNGRIVRCTITDALSSCQSAASRLQPAALCAAGLESAPLSQPSRRPAGRERPPFGCPVLRPTPGPEGVAHAPRACLDHPARRREPVTPPNAAPVCSAVRTSFALTARAPVRFFRETASI
jgi:hypothetical protein